MTGRIISHYRLEEKLGEGGMGVVYRAQDLALNRSVAIKFLGRQVGREDHRQRFKQEAQTASALNHPHILTVHEVGRTHEGEDYLVLEYVEGWTFREWVGRAQPVPRQLADVAATIASALACAHDAGIVHRDIKPENILVSRQGYAKLADFGLAKLVEQAAPAGGDTATVSLKTQPGMILGTLAYMAPEQVCGRPVDARADLFSFGAVLYEALTGARPFDGASDTDTAMAILHREPVPLGELRPDVSYELRMVVEKALEKDPADRYQSARDMVVDLRRVQRVRSSESAVPAVPIPRHKPLRVWVAGLLAVAVIAIMAWHLGRTGSSWRNPLAEARFTRLTDYEGTEREAAVSADGKFVLFLSDRSGIFDAWLMHASGGEPINLTKGRFPSLVHDELRSIGFSRDGTQVWIRSPARVMPLMGGEPRLLIQNAYSLDWSPDGKSILYETNLGTREKQFGDALFVSDAQGTNSRRIHVEAAGGHAHFPTWSPDGRYAYFVRGIFPREKSIFRVPASGGDAEQITPERGSTSSPAFLDAHTMVYTATAEDGSGPWLYVTDVEKRRVQRASSGVERYLSIAASAPRNGRVSRFVATVANPSGNLWTVPITDAVVGESAVERFAVPTVRAVSPRWARDCLIYLSSTTGADGIWRFKDGAATELWKGSDGAVTDIPTVSPDGTQLCFTRRRNGRSGLFLMKTGGSEPQPIAPSLDVRGSAAWSPDGQWIAVAAETPQGDHLYKINMKGGDPQVLIPQQSYNPAWSPDGEIILYEEALSGSSHTIKAVTAEGLPIHTPPAHTRSGGHRIAFLGPRTAVVLLGQFRAQDFWLLDLSSGKLRRLTSLKPGYAITAFDILPDGRTILFDRNRENSDIVLIDLPTE